jgi:hypothetical protein
MFNKTLVKKALSHSLSPVNKSGWTNDTCDSLVSLLIHDIFGGEILKTHKKSGWHFYNRINGERIDLVSAQLKKAKEVNGFEDLPSTPEETLNYIAQEDYSTFQARFIGAFEEEVGLENYNSTVNLA